MLDLREFDLELAFGAARPQCEDVEDQADPIDDAALQHPFEVALLRAGEFVVEDDKIALRGYAAGADLVDLALAGEQRRIGPLAPAGDVPDDGGPGGQRQRLELVHPLRGIPLPEVETDEDGPVATGRTLKHGRATQPRETARRECDGAA